MIKNYTLLCRNIRWREAAIILSYIAAAYPYYKIFNIQWIENNFCSDLYIDLTATSNEINNILKMHTRFEIYDVWEIN